MRALAFAFVTLTAAPTAIASGGQLPILGGTQTQVGDYPTVVAVEIGGALCTGTLIHPEWVLTAAHCVSPSVLGFGSQAQLTAATRVRFDSVTAYAGGGRAIAAAETFPHPGFNVNNLGDNDIGLIHLAEPVDDRMVTRVNRSAADAPVGVVVDFVGFGKTTSGTAGREYELLARTSVSCSIAGASNANLLCFNQQDGKGQCEGDSGGPTFVDIDGVKTVVGITSFGDQNCAFFGADTRVDAEIGFADEKIGPSLRCVWDGECATGCSGDNIDPDCPTCTKDSDCEGDEICLNGCQPAPFSPGGLGSDCVNDDDCVAGLCMAAGDVHHCSSDCDPQGECPSGFDCLTTDSGGGACWPSSSGGGGCAASDDGGLPAAGGVILGLLGLVALRRRGARSA